ncbi:hypothetical protein E1281_20245 [Actinomadura sp. KC345]|uniref:hypothetical protein n=1 Tax=Actinomadura sp. KC345 TaxID=2530371 RepID=UPI00104C00CD|nr:hypothetical protein [Actinomadura sp. KC345]TDC51557.1 hypothetical protein E1281_20245 [Actinomadura sp. KC345]
MSDSSAGAGRTGERRARRRRTPAQQALIWGLIAVTSYGLTLSVISDTFFWFAIPGMLGLLTAVIIATHAVLNRPPGNGDLRVLLKRYAVIVLVCVVMVAVPLLVDVRYLYPFVGIGMMTLVVGGKILAEQRRAAP